MSLKLLRLSFLITICTSSPIFPSRLPDIPVSIIWAQLESQRTAFSPAAMMATRRHHARRFFTSGLSVPSAVSRKGVPYGSYEIADAEDMVPTEEKDTTNPSIDTRLLRPTNVDFGTLSCPPLATATASTCSETLLVPSAASLSRPGILSNLVGSQSGPVSHSSVPPAITPAFVGSAMGAIFLASLTLLVVCRRRTLARGRSKRGIPGLRGWFNSDKTNGVVFIRVPPPTMPLKSILIRNTSLSSASDDACSDRISVTSSQMSVLINKLPKSYDSGLENGVLDEAREHGRNFPMKAATRIGPSQSEFLTNLFGLGNADSFSSSTSSTSGESTLPPSLSSCSLQHSPPRSQPASYSAYDLPSLTLVNSPKPTFPPAVASPTLGHTIGPRGHGLVLTGDSNLTPSFAQWHHQRSIARERDGALGYGSQL